MSEEEEHFYTEDVNVFIRHTDVAVFLKDYDESIILEKKHDVIKDMIKKKTKKLHPLLTRVQEEKDIIERYRLFIKSRMLSKTIHALHDEENSLQADRVVVFERLILSKRSAVVQLKKLLRRVDSNVNVETSDLMMAIDVCQNKNHMYSAEEQYSILSDLHEKLMDDHKTSTNGVRTWLSATRML